MVPLSDEVRMVPLEPTTTCDGLEVVLVVVGVSLLLLQEMMVRLKIISYILCNTLVYIKIMYKIIFIFYLNTKSKILLVRRTQYIPLLGVDYNVWGFYLVS